MRATMAFVGGVVTGILIVILGLHFKLFNNLALLAPGPLTTTECQATVKLSLKPASTPGGKMTIVADPTHAVCLAVGQPMNWEILDGGTVTIDFDKNPDYNDLKGPFLPVGVVGPLTNTDRGLYGIRNPNPGPSYVKVTSAGAEDRPGRWKYKVKWLPLGPGDVEELDPVVCIRK